MKSIDIVKIMRSLLVLGASVAVIIGMIVGIGYGRDNPFEPMIKPQEDNIASNKAKDYFMDFDFKLPSTARILKEITITYQNIDGSIQTQTFPIDKSIDWHYPLLLTQKSAIISEDTQYFVIKPFEFYTQGSKLYLHTTQDIVRSFILPTPYRIVLDVKRTDKEVSGFVDIGRKYFSKVSVGTHKDFYRFVITLDGQYTYSINKDDEYYIISVQ
ncbi:AMIN domain-containing protein [uncultured Helicobacter sp.]|uniref:AMIN domain-containing protein n=1 Tax=uncultured Helicobacter sp. TaxID=175537 RepID=UPI002587343A|nr:AMIN domain-containing protein [uncultured Helicobacter sp.]